MDINRSEKSYILESIKKCYDELNNASFDSSGIATCIVYESELQRLRHQWYELGGFGSELAAFEKQFE